MKDRHLPVRSHNAPSREPNGIPSAARSALANQSAFGHKRLIPLPGAGEGRLRMG